MCFEHTGKAYTLLICKMLEACISSYVGRMRNFSRLIGLIGLLGLLGLLGLIIGLIIGLKGLVGLIYRA